jgi:uncharacterized membrane protein YfcA
MWLWILATIVAFFIKGLCGFANTLVFTSILGFGTSNVNISPVELVLGYPTNVILTWENRKKLQIKVWLPLAILVLSGSIPGAFLLKNVNVQYIKILFGIVVILVGIEMLCRENIKEKHAKSNLFLGVIGILSGILCGLFGVGALLAAYVGRVTGTSDEFKANISAVFIVENTFRIILYSILGVITLSSLKRSLIMMPFMLIGLFAGIKSCQLLNEKTVKKLVIILLIISGIAMILKSVYI